MCQSSFYIFLKYFSILTFWPFRAYDYKKAPGGAPYEEVLVSYKTFFDKYKRWILLAFTVTSISLYFLPYANTLNQRFRLFNANITETFWLIIWIIIYIVPILFDIFCIIVNKNFKYIFTFLLRLPLLFFWTLTFAFPINAIPDIAYYLSLIQLFILIIYFISSFCIFIHIKISTRSPQVLKPHKPTKAERIAILEKEVAELKDSRR
jgi:hypothetical protein